LAFKEENKWRLHDGNSGISARIEDETFLCLVDSNALSFAKGDILICNVRVTQTQTREGLKTEYTVARVADHKPAPRQLNFLIEDMPNEERTARIGSRNRPEE
jgi:hypothetical protein